MKTNYVCTAFCLILIATTHAVAQSTSNKCAPAGVSEGMTYKDARTKITAQGFIPAGEKPSDGSYCSPERSGNAQTCRKMTEISDCSGSGYCQMRYKGKDGGNLVINIFGDGPDSPDAIIRSIVSDCRSKQVKI